MSYVCSAKMAKVAHMEGYNMSRRALSARERTSSVRKRTLGHTHDSLSSEIRKAAIDIIAQEPWPQEPHGDGALAVALLQP